MAYLLSNRNRLNFGLTFLLVQKSNKKRPPKSINSPISGTAMCNSRTTVTSTFVILLFGAIVTIISKPF